MNRTNKLSKRQILMFIAGVVALVIGVSGMSFIVIRKIRRDIKREKLMRENTVVEIPSLNIKAPVLEGTDNEILAKAVGHFTETGSVGNGNYCIAGHSSTIYKEYFNNLKNAEIGMEVDLFDKFKNKFVYNVTEKFVVEPSETWILNNFGDNRVTLVTCTDSGEQRLIIVASKKD